MTRKLVSSILLAAFVAVLSVGCGSMPTAPNAPGVIDPASAVKQSETAGSTGLISDLIGVVDSLVGLIVKTLKLIGSLGGSLTNGRWTVNISAGAVDGNATVSLGVQNPLSSSCQLEIQPANLNHFDEPVTLTVSCPNVSRTDLARYVIFWRDPATGNWVQVPGSTVDFSNRTVSAPLQHFSTYRTGPSETKAGW